MICYIFKTKDPYFNLAAEEFLLKNEKIKEDILILWQNQNTIVIGCNQNTYSEINIKECEANNVTVIRRITGGGAVFHDLGNLNFSYILKNKDKIAPKHYEEILTPIINALKKLGLNAHFSGKNDVEIDNKKISGNAQYLYKNNLLHHGTLLFDVDLSKIKNYLNVNKKKIESRGIASAASRVTNILPLLEKKITIEQFRDYIVKELIGNDNSKLKDFNKDEIQEINKISNDKFKKWEWTFSKLANFDFTNDIRIENKGTLQFNANIVQGIIKDCKFFGDYLGFKGTEKIENKLNNKKYDPIVIKEELLNVDLSAFGNNFEVEDIISVMFTD